MIGDIPKLILAGLVSLGGFTLRPMQTALQDSRQIAARLRVQIYVDPLQALPALCADSAWSNNQTPPRLPAFCKGSLAWRQHGEWQDLCGAHQVDAAATRPERYYRLTVDCHLELGYLSFPLPLLQATILR